MPICSASLIRNDWRTRLCTVPGVMEHGLFINVAQTVILAGPNGVRLIERQP